MSADQLGIALSHQRKGKVFVAGTAAPGEIPIDTRNRRPSEGQVHLFTGSKPIVGRLEEPGFVAVIGPACVRKT
jgi:hypothetical protein